MNNICFTEACFISDFPLGRFKCKDVVPRGYCRRLPVLHHNADYIYLLVLWVDGLILECFEYAVLLKYSLEGVSTAHEQTQ